MRVEITELPKWKDTVTVKTWINTLENSRSVRALELYVNGIKLVGSETFWAVFNTKTRRPEQLALPYSHFKLFPENKATNESFSKINVLGNTEIVLKKTVLLSDLDIVNHVNNVKYLEWCLDFVPTELILNQKVANFEMNFMKELSLGDSISIHENATQNKTIFSVAKEDKNCFAFELNWK
jgi:acyl-ACP thioesterase